MVRFLAGRCRISTCGRVGGHGIITGLLNIFPAHAVKAWELGEAGKYDEARKYDELIERGSKVTSLNKSGSGNSGVVGGLKAALKVMGIIDHDTVTMPHRPLSEEEKAQIPVILKSVGVL
jgi:4-hydroxy-tetrahydrodipicolinate synthase